MIFYKKEKLSHYIRKECHHHQQSAGHAQVRQPGQCH